MIFIGHFFKEKFQNLTNENSTLIDDEHWKEQFESCKKDSEDLASKVEILTNQCSSNDHSATTSDETTGICLLWTIDDSL